MKKVLAFLVLTLMSVSALAMDDCYWALDKAIYSPGPTANMKANRICSEFALTTCTAKAEQQSADEDTVLKLRNQCLLSGSVAANLKTNRGQLTPRCSEAVQNAVSTDDTQKYYVASLSCADSCNRSGIDSTNCDWKFMHEVYETVKK